MASEPLLDITVADGKYRIIQDENGTRALRYGKPVAWPTNNIVMAMAHEIEELRERQGGETALAVGEDAFRAGFRANTHGSYDPELCARAWSEYDPPEHIKALV